jgi:predicted dehydrogenase
MRIVVASSRLSARRRQALSRVVGAGGDPVFLPMGDLEDVTGGDRPAAVVIDGPESPPSTAVVARLRDWVDQGTYLLGVGLPAGREAAGGWTDVFSATAQPALRAGEIFARVAEPGHPLAARVDDEFPIVDAFQPMSPTGDAMTAVLQVTYRFVNQAAVLAANVGAGRVVVSGLGGTDEALDSPALVTVLRRAVRPPSPSLTPARASLGLGIVGYGPFGGMGLIHGTAVTATEGLDLVAVCDSDAARRKAAEHDFPGVRVHARVEDLAADGDVDAAVVATPPSAHVAVVSTLLRAGKHVVCEKPLCFSVADADRLFALAGQHELTLTVHQSRRWDPDYRAIRAAVDQGALGDVFNVETFVGGFEHPCRAWHSEAAVSGGLVYDWGAHHVDWILQLLGSMPDRVTATGHKRVWHDVTNLDQLRVRMQWDDGREAEFLASDVAAVRRPKFYVQGTAGTLVGRYRDVVFEHVDPTSGYVRRPAHHAEAPAGLVLAHYRSGSGVSQSTVALAPDAPFAFHRNLADHLLLGEPLAVEPQSVREVTAVLEAATRSASEGGRALRSGRGSRSVDFR